MPDEHIRILGNRKKVCYKYNITDFSWYTFLWEGKIAWYNHQLSPYKNGIEWVKDERPSDIILVFSFRCLLPKADFRIFYFELKTLLNKLVILCSSFFFQKNDFEQKCRVLFSSKKSTYFLTGPNHPIKSYFLFMYYCIF